MNRLGKMNHFPEFISNMRGTAYPIVIGHRGGGSDENIGDARFTTAVTLPVIGSKSLHQHDRKIIFTVHKNPFPGDEYILKDG